MSARPKAIKRARLVGGASSASPGSSAAAEIPRAASVPVKQYIMCAEHNTKEGETSYYYLQYNGNEDAVARLNTVMERAASALDGGDNVWHMLSSPKALLCEAAVDEIVAAASAGGFGGQFFASFAKCDGKLSFNDKKYAKLDSNAVFAMWQRAFYRSRSRGIAGLFSRDAAVSEEEGESGDEGDSD